MKITPVISSKKIAFLLPLICFSLFNLLELFLLTTHKNMLGVFFSPIAIFICGLFSGIFFLVFFQNKKYPIQNSSTSSQRTNWMLLFLLFFFGTWLCGDAMRQIINGFPFDNFYDPKGTDAIPQIGIMVDRFLSGEQPYQWIHKEWTLAHALFPTYLPLTWMPFLIPELLNFDYRWLSFSLLLLSFLYLFYKVVKWKFNKTGICFLIIFTFYTLSIFQKGDRSCFQLTVETLITGYYLFLATTIFSKSSWQIGVALLCCLLSRYSVVLWVPLFFLIYFCEGKVKDLIKISAVLLIGFLVLYFIPFLSKDITIFNQGYDYHTHAAKEMWKIIIDGKPVIFFNGHGLAEFFYTYYPGTIEEKLQACRLTHLLASAGTIGILGIIYFRVRKTMDYRIFLLGSLKIYLVVFYNFIQIPFNYLFMVPFFISLPMLALLWLELQDRISQNKGEQIIV